MTHKLIEKYKPYLILSEGEKYQPTSIEKYIRMCEFRHENRKIDLTFDQIAYSKDLNYGKNFRMHIKPQFLATYRETKSHFPPVYTYVNKKGNKTQIIYYFFYNYNGPKNVFGLFPFGEHNADIEWVCLELHKNKPEYVYLSRHGNNVKYYYEDLELHKGRAVIYSAINSHAHYPDPGIYFRLLGLGNDVCTEGKKIDPVVRELDDNSPLITYKGKMGDSNKVDSMGRYQDNWIY
tara:strand:+ start:2002 stop:2706 length:705 start_codon:yes stop_codon:yes gene_type:complete